MFDLSKQQALSKLDKSKKGYIDEEILPLITALNKKKNFYTTSSCAGRIVLLELRGKKKHDAHWIFCSHKKAEGIESEISEYPVWFRYDPPIIHLSCRTLEDAKIFLEIAKNAGFKHTGIISLGRIMVELIGYDKIATLVSRDGKPLVDKEYLNILTELANECMERNRLRLQALYESLDRLT
ncbi:MAG: tRNA wybutosine-synthesizing 3 family protein [Candidatus Woesearchaeota archaeon]